MGVPAFFKWLAHKYPKTVEPAMEAVVEGDNVWVDLDLPNPNGVEYDNLYLDMNGLVHPCCHSCVPLPKDEEEMMIRIFNMVDDLVSIVRPRRVLYLALDGPAPRAKINQQRARRFKAGKEQVQLQEIETMLESYLAESGRKLPEKPPAWDRNVITPGTTFMEKVTHALQWYIHERMNSDPFFSKLTIILSDGSVPGEGEHKIMNYIRACRTQTTYDPNTRHVVYGMDADLVMLALTTHEPHFSVIREHIDWTKPQEKGRDKASCSPGMSQFDFLHCAIVREYLEADMTALKQRALPMEYDFERVVDDFVFICFFCGNDFLPCIPSLEIREGGLDILIDYYTTNLEIIGGYITDHGEVNFQRAAALLEAIGEKEEAILSIRQERKMAFFNKRQDHMFGKRRARVQILDMLEKNMKEGLSEPTELVKEYMGTLREHRQDIDGMTDHSLRFGVEGWRTEYYKKKFSSTHEGDSNAAMLESTYHYLIGVQWVMRYYFQGTASWTWCYPYHYPPLASDLCAVARTMSLSTFTPLERPFSPTAQLMSVMPPESVSALPTQCKWFMTAPDSPIADFYPDALLVDYAGCKFEWMGVILLPQIDETRMQETVANLVEPHMTEEEKKRNELGKDLIFAHSSTRLGQVLDQIRQGNGTVHRKGSGLRATTEVVAELKQEYPENMYTEFDWYDADCYEMTDTSEGIGRAQVSAEHGCPVGGTFVSPYAALDVGSVENNQVVCATYLLPEYVPHGPSLLPDCILPPQKLSEADVTLTANFVFDPITDLRNPLQSLSERANPVRLSDPNNPENPFNKGGKGGKKGGHKGGSKGKKGHSLKGGSKGGKFDGGGKGGGKFSPPKDVKGFPLSSRNIPPVRASPY